MSLLQLFSFYGKIYGSKTTTSKARIQKTLTSTQGSVARIIEQETVNQTSVARIINTLTATQSSKARIEITNTSTETSKARITTTQTSTQGEVARIQKTSTALQTEIARIAKTLTSTEPSKARIQNTFSVTQTEVARILKTLTSTQNEIARISKSFTSTQTEKARIQKILTSTQTSKASVAIIPYVSSTTTAQTTTSSTTGSITLPTYTAGQLVFVAISAASASPNTPSGWSVVDTGEFGYMRLMTGTEGSTLALTFTASTTFSGIAVAFGKAPTGYSVEYVAGSFAGTQTPPAISGLPLDNWHIMSISSAAYTTGNPTVTAFPSNMPYNNTAVGTNATNLQNGVAIASARVQQITSFTPNTFTWTPTPPGYSSATFALRYAYTTVTTTSKARIRNTLTKTQTSTARIIKTQTATQTSKADIRKTLSTTQTSIARIAPIHGTQIDIPFQMPENITLTIAQQPTINVSVSISNTLTIPVQQNAMITISLNVTYPQIN